MTTFVIVPVLNEWDHTRALLNSLDAAEVDDVLVLDNGSTDETAQRIRQWQRAQRYAEYYPLGPKLHRRWCPGLSVYEMWNAGFDRARRLSGNTIPGQWNPMSRAEFYVLVTNNDVTLPAGAISALRGVLRSREDCWASYPDYDAAWSWETPDRTSLRLTRGVLSSGGLFGACFMLAGHRIPWSPLITDLEYEWWYGDDHLAECIEQAGGLQARVVGLPVWHHNEGTAGKLNEGVLWGMKYRDRQRWITRHERQA